MISYLLLIGIGALGGLIFGQLSFVLGVFLKPLGLYLSVVTGSFSGLLAGLYAEKVLSVVVVVLIAGVAGVIVWLGLFSFGIQLVDDQFFFWQALYKLSGYVLYLSPGFTLGLTQLVRAKESIHAFLKKRNKS